MDLRLGTSEYEEAPVESPRAEVRFGLVLYGGVSLAIYIYGVVYEFWRLIKASEGVETNAYTALLEETSTTAAVDIVSGTSAGGINGILLAKALTTGADLEKVKRIWVKEANLKDLLRERGDTDADSLLRTDSFERLLTEGLAAMDASAAHGKSLVKAFDLFVSATRLQPWIRDFLTDLDTEIATADYRKSFQLKHRTAKYNPERPGLGYERHDFARAKNQALVAIARATSAFPGAFEPRLISHEKDDPLYRDGEPPASFFSDGGILNNKPFTETVSTIIARANDRPVERWLVSVEPDPEEFTQEAASEPPVDEVIGKAAIGIPRYQSIAADLDRLAEYRRHARRETNRLESIDRGLALAVDAPDSDTTIAALRDQFESSPAYIAYRTERIYQLSSDLAYEIASATGLGEAETEIIRDGLQGALQTSDYTLPDFSFERRRLYHVIGRAIELGAQLEPPYDEMVRSQIQVLWGQFDAIGAALWQVQHDREGPDASVLNELSPEHLQSFAIDLIPLLRKALRNIVPAELVIADHPSQPPAVGAVRNLDFAVRGAQVEGPSVGFWELYRYFALWDQYLLPTDPRLGVTPRASINLARVSPKDATHIGVSAEDKLAGDALFHFGGFLREEWRRNDILWGRLDAAEMIVRMLAKGRSLDQVSVKGHIERVQKEVFAAELPDVKGDYRHHLEKDYGVGGEGLEKIPMQERASLVVRTADVARNMVAKLGDPSRGSRFAGAYKWVGVALAWLLALVRWPVLAIWGDDPAWRRIAGVIVLFVGGWAAVTLVLALTDVIDAKGNLWGLIGIGLGIFVIWTVLNLVFVVSERRARRRASR